MTFPWLLVIFGLASWALAGFSYATWGVLNSMNPYQPPPFLRGIAAWLFVVGAMQLIAAPLIMIWSVFW